MARTLSGLPPLSGCCTSISLRNAFLIVLADADLETSSTCTKAQDQEVNTSPLPSSERMLHPPHPPNPQRDKSSSTTPLHGQCARGTW
jgi:hypothetical protein